MDLERPGDSFRIAGDVTSVADAHRRPDAGRLFRDMQSGSGDAGKDGTPETKDAPRLRRRGGDMVVRPRFVLALLPVSVKARAPRLRRLHAPFDLVTYQRARLTSASERIDFGLPAALALLVLLTLILYLR